MFPIATTRAFPTSCCATDHPFPQLLKHRGAKIAEGVYFGPFARAGAVNRTLNTLQRAFLLRSCSDSVFAGRTRPCLLFQIKRCSAPCVGPHRRGGLWRAGATRPKDFLTGKSRAVQEELVSEMNAASEALDFEARRAAARPPAGHEPDPGASGHQSRRPSPKPICSRLHREGGNTCIQVFFFRAGQNWGNRPYFPRHAARCRAGEVAGSVSSASSTTSAPRRR